MAKNKVIAGDYLNSLIVKNFGQISLRSGFNEIIQLNQTTIENYELITEEHRKSAVSGVSRGLVGGVLLGPVGLLAGLSAKSKGTHFVAIEFKDGKKSLIEMDDKIYKMLIQIMFKSSNSFVSESTKTSSNNFTPSQKKKGCSPVGCLAIIAIAIISMIIIGAIQNSNENIELVVDAEKFSKINAEKLVSIMGKPEKIENHEWLVPKTGEKIEGKLYIYENNKFEFLIFNDIVVRMSIYSGKYMGYGDFSMEFNKEEDIFKMFGISPSKKVSKVADTNYALRYRNVSEAVEEVWILEIENKDFGVAKFTYDSKYF